jgi:hypothetical protein
MGNLFGCSFERWALSCSWFHWDWLFWHFLRGRELFLLKHFGLLCFRVSRSIPIAM